MRHPVWAGRMHRHPAGDGRPPARHRHRCRRSPRIRGRSAGPRHRAGAGGDPGGMPLGAARHALGPRPDRPHRPAQHPGGDRQHRLHRHVELAAEAAPQAEGMIRTACGGMPSTPATSSRSIYGAWVEAKTSIRLPIRRAQPASGSIYGMLDEAASSIPAATCRSPARAAATSPARQAPAGQHIARPAGMQAGAPSAARRSVGERRQHLPGQRDLRHADRRRAWRRSPTRAQTVSPRWRTSAPAKTGWSLMSG